MSRFPELFEQAIDEVVIGEALLVEELAEHIAREIAARQEAVRAEVRIAARYPMRRTTPVTGLETQQMVSLIGVAAASERGVRRLVGVEATGMNACPCAQGLVRSRSAERLAEAGFGELDVERILELVPLATHNQRGRGTLYVGTAQPVNAEDLVGIVESSMSAPIAALLKRPDELFVVEHAHLRPRFVEDSVRAALARDARPLRRARGRRLRALAAGQLRDDPRPRRRRRAARHGRRAAGGARARRAAAAPHAARGVAQPVYRFLTNRAPTLVAAVIGTRRSPCPLHAPAQRPRRQPKAGRASNRTARYEVNACQQPAQTIPAALLTTPPAPATETTSR